MTDQRSCLASTRHALCGVFASSVLLLCVSGCSNGRGDCPAGYSRSDGEDCVDRALFTVDELKCWDWADAEERAAWSWADVYPVVSDGGVPAAPASSSVAALAPAGPLDINADRAGIISIRMRSAALSEAFSVSFATEEEPTLNEHVVPMALASHVAGTSTFTARMASHPAWRGKVVDLRIYTSTEFTESVEVVEVDRLCVGTDLARPNVIVLLADDMGWRDCSACGSTYYETPNIDSIAYEGIRFTNAYSASPLCSPTRASVLTGQWPARLRLTAPMGHQEVERLDPVVRSTASSSTKLLEPESRNRLPNDELTYAEVLRGAGYATAFMGKWHLGRDPYVPSNQGYDVVVGGTYHPGPPGGYFSPFQADGNLPETPDGTHANAILAQEASTFIAEHQAGPFLLDLWFYDVHTPLQADPDMRAEYVGRTSADGRQRNPTMAAMLATMDAGVGQVLRTLEELGLDDNTLILFTSDNGGNMYLWVDGAMPTSNYPLRQGKGSLYEGGTRVPMMVSWPGVVQARSSSAELVSSVDIFETLMEVTSTVSVAPRPVDGVSFVPALLGNESERTLVFGLLPHTIPAVAQRAGATLRNEDWKLHQLFHDHWTGGGDESHRFELYDLAADPGETHDLAPTQPAMVASLALILDAHLAETNALVPEVNPAYAPAPMSWTPNEQAFVTLEDDGSFIVTSNGWAPALESEDISSLSAPAAIVLTTRSRSHGQGRVQWRGAAESFTDQRSVAFGVIHDDLPHTYRVDVSPAGPVAQLRIQTSSDAHQVEVLSIVLEDDVGAVIGSWGAP